MRFTRLQRYLLSIFSGVLMVISFPHTGSLFPLVFMAWVPLLLVEHSIYKEKYHSRTLFIHSFITFLIYNAGAAHWIYFSIGGEIGAIVGFILFGIIMAFVFMMFHWAKKFIGQKEGYLSLFFFWIGFEYINFQWELSWPWLTLGNTFAVVPEIVQWYSYTGILGGSFWILLVNLVFFKIIANLLFRKESWKTQTPLFYLLALLIIVPSGLSWWKYATFQETKNPIEIVVTQPNIDPYNEKFSNDIHELKEHLDKFMLRANELITDSTAIVLAPETAIAMGFNEEDYEKSPSFNYVQNIVNSWKTTALLTGASTYRFFEKQAKPSMKPIRGTDFFYESYNTSVLLSKEKPPLFVHKSKLVLGVEKIPFASWFPYLEELSVQNGGTSGTLGVEDEPQILRVNGFAFAPVVCYESVYGDFVATQCRKGAEAIFIITNDGWWGNSAGHKQHASLARLRAIETRRYVARSANTGISSIINERGDVIKATDYWTEDAFRTTIQLNDQSTFYIQYGDVMGRAFAFVFFLLNLYTIVKFVKRKFL